MAARLARRGPDGQRQWTDGPIALGHALLAATPEALHEALPLRDEATGCVVTADVRLDNREELLAALHLAQPGRIVGDGELILRAYLAWGEACPLRLLGDFAFALWDPRHRRLFAARDQAGLKPLAFAHIPGRVLALASDPRSVTLAGGVPPDIDEGRLLDHLEDHLEPLDAETTWFRAVRRLPPAHLLLADPQGVAVRRYWRLEPGEPLRLDGPGYAEGFREVLASAVRARLRSAGPVGSMLSGGLDSGAVAALAARDLAADGRGPLPTFPVIGGDDGESRAIRESLAMPGLAPHLIEIGDLGPWRDDLLAALGDLDEPGDGSLHLLRAAYLAASRAGVRVVLDGVQGDITLSSTLRLPRLLRAGRLLSAWQEAAGLERHEAGARSRWAFLAEAVQNAAPLWTRHLSRRLKRRADGRPRGRLVQPGFAAEAGLAARAARWREANPVRPVGTPEARAERMLTHHEAGYFEAFDRLAAARGIEARSPFADLRVLDFALRCPLDRMLRDGWPKRLLRDAMTGLLPDAVLWRTGPSHLGPVLSAALLDGLRVPPPLNPSTAGGALMRRATGLGPGDLAGRPLGGGDTQRLWFLSLWLDSLEAGR